MATPRTLINGQAYAYSDIQFRLMGLPAYEGFNGIPIQGISFTENQPSDYHYENSRRPTAISYGNIEVNGSLTFTIDALETVRDRIFEFTGQSRSLVDLPPIDIYITFANAGKVNSIQILSAKLEGNDFSASSGDTMMQVTVPYRAAAITYGNLTVELAIAANQAINGNDNQR